MIFKNANKLLGIILCLLLASCGKSVKKDGPPNFYVDETRIPNAVPKAEHRAKYGNMKSYQVFGKRYYVMPSNKNYEAVGKASWYGTLFHNRRTSSGEKYNMLGMTAAHKTLPLPTYVEVTNLANNKKVVVKVNDRGPFHGDRLIDLSYVAAKKLGMIGRGTSYVKIRAINPYPSRNLFYFTKKNNDAHFGHQDKFFLQVGAFRSKANAIKMQQRLSKIFSTPIFISSPSGKNFLYRVNIGPFLDEKLADQITFRLKHLGIKTFQTQLTRRCEGKTWPLNKTYGA